MIEWTVFYRLLGLSEEFDEPSYYQLLGVDPHNCQEDKVDHALMERKKTLRQNLPSPHFIPLVLKFETEQLDPAAAVLKDAAQRAEYDQELIKRALERGSEKEKNHRRKVIKAGRKLVMAAIDKNGTLDESRRPVLARKLSQLSLSGGDIRVLFAGIPTSEEEEIPSQEEEIDFFVHSVELAVSEGFLTRKDEKHLLELADSLQVPMEAVEEIIEEQLGRYNARRTEPGGKEDNDKEQEESERAWLWVVTGVVILIAVGLLILVFSRTGSRGDKKDETPLSESAAEPEDIIHSGQIEEKKFSSRLPESKPAKKESVSVKVSDYVRYVRSSYSVADEVSYVLADMVLTMLAGCERVARFVDYRDNRYRALVDQFITGDHPERIERIMEEGGSLFAEFSLPVTPPQTDFQKLDKLQKELTEEKDKVKRYRVIDRLRFDNSFRAAEILLEYLDEERELEQVMVCRVLRGLREMDDPRIPEKLIEIMGRRRKWAVVHPIVQTLIYMNGLEGNTPDDCEGILPFSYTRNQVKQSVLWWEEFYARQRSGLVRSYGLDSSKKKPRDSMGQREERWLKLTLMVVYYADQMSGLLKRFDWGEIAGQSEDEEIFFSGQQRDVSGQLTASLEKVVDECLRLVRKHPKGKQHSVEIDMIEWRRQSGMLLSDNTEEKVRHSLQITGELLNMLARFMGAGTEAEKMRDRILRQDDKVGGNKSDLLKLREGFYVNLALWDLLTQLKMEGLSVRGQGKEKDFLVKLSESQRSKASVTLKTKEKDEDKSLDGQIARQCRLWRDNPLDANVSREIRKLRAQKQEEYEQALTALRLSLQAYRDRRYFAVAERLRKVVKNNAAVELAERFLSVSIREILAEAEKEAAQPVCSHCGGSKEIDCDRCKGLGLYRCSACKGQGKIRRLDKKTKKVRLRPCGNCYGRGWEQCVQCRGRGTNRCADCASSEKNKGQSQQLRLGREIGQLLRFIVYLQTGGIDFD